MCESRKVRAARYRRIAELLHQPEVKKVVLDPPHEWEHRADELADERATDPSADSDSCPSDGSRSDA